MNEGLSHHTSAVSADHIYQKVLCADGVQPGSLRMIPFNEELSVSYQDVDICNSLAVLGNFADRLGYLSPVLKSVAAPTKSLTPIGCVSITRGNLSRLG